MQITITNVTVVRDHYGPDHVYFHTTLTSPVWPFDQPATAEITVARGTAEAWLKANGFNDFKLVESK